MNQQEAAALLGVAAAFDNRKPDPDAATAWSVALDGLRFQDCRDAVIAHYRASSEWLMPAVVIAEVKRIRRDRLTAHGPIEPPHDMDPDDTVAYFRWRKDAQKAIADGETIPSFAEVQSGAPIPKELGEAMRNFGRLPADVESDGGETA